MLNAIFQLSHNVAANKEFNNNNNEETVFECTNNPINDYHNLTKNFNVNSFLKRVNYYYIILKITKKFIRYNFL